MRGAYGRPLDGYHLYQTFGVLGITLHERPEPESTSCGCISDDKVRCCQQTYRSFATRVSHFNCYILGLTHHKYILTNHRIQ